MKTHSRPPLILLMHRCLIARRLYSIINQALIMQRSNFEKASARGHLIMCLHELQGPSNKLIVLGGSGGSGGGGGSGDPRRSILGFPDGFRIEPRMDPWMDSRMGPRIKQ